MAAAALLVIMLVSPLLWSKKHGSISNKFPNSSVILQKESKIKAETLGTIPDSMNSVAHREIKKQPIVNNKVYKQHLPDVNNTINDKLKKDTSYLVKTKTDTSHIAENEIAHTSVPNASNHNENEIVHINNVDTDQPALEHDPTKWRRFMRRYDLDILNKEAATSSIKNKSLTQNFN